MENPIKMDDLGVPLFLETPKWNTSFQYHKNNLTTSNIKETSTNPRLRNSTAGCFPKKNAVSEDARKNIQLPTNILSMGKLHLWGLATGCVLPMFDGEDVPKFSHDSIHAFKLHG